MLILAVVFFFLTVFLLVYNLLLAINKEKFVFEKRLKLVTREVRRQDFYEERLAAPFYERLIHAVLAFFTSFSGRLLSSRRSKNMAKKLMMAGNPLGLNPAEFTAVYYVIIFISAVMGLTITTLMRSTYSARFFALVWGGILGYLLVMFFLKRRILLRQSAINKSLPAILDLITVSVEAGLGFDQAIQKVTEKFQGPLADEFTKTLKEIKMGKERRLALLEMGKRVGTPELEHFITAIVQAEKLGVPMSNILRIQSKQLRTARKQKIEEQAMKAPIKMLVPLVFFIFPAIFIVILGPAMINIIDVFK